MSCFNHVAVALTALFLFSGPALADWNPTDPHKMHFPQLPNPQGWDVDITTLFVADDWLCTGSGPVTDIHFWLSAKGDLAQAMQNLIWVNIYSDIPDPDGTGPVFSQPNRQPAPLWSRIFTPNQYAVGPPLNGTQGWYSPGGPEYGVIPIDHQFYWQINITSIVEPFVQQEGNVYWLELHVTPPDVVPTARYGWKTSLDHWNDDAVWSLDGASTQGELRDPATQQSLDMAFVITPEPSAGVAGLALLLLLSATARRRRA